MKQYVEQVVIAKPNWCVPAVLEMVLRHHGISTFSQKDIANHLNIIPMSDAVSHSQWGAKIKNHTINNLFRANSIPLREEYIPINQFMDEFYMLDRIVELLNQHISIICGYNYTSIFGHQEDSFQNVSIIVDASLESDNVLLLDPGPKDAGYKTVNAEHLFYAIRAANDGLWCIS